MRKAKVYVKGIEAGILTESKQGKEYVFEYLDGYERLEVSRTMPTKEKVYRFDRFPPFSVSPVPRCFKQENKYPVFYIRCLFLNAIPEPLLRYFSNFRA